LKFVPLPPRERLLLVDPASSTTITKQLVALVVGELARAVTQIKFSLN